MLFVDSWTISLNQHEVVVVCSIGSDSVELTAARQFHWFDQAGEKLRMYFDVLEDCLIFQLEYLSVQRIGEVFLVKK